MNKYVHFIDFILLLLQEIPFSIRQLMLTSIIIILLIVSELFERSSFRFEAA